MISKKTLAIIVYFIFIGSFLALSLASTTTINEQTLMCNNCHGPTATGHVDFSVTLTTSPAVETEVPTTITATMKNNNYPLDTVSVLLKPSADFSFTGGSSSSLTVGTLARSSSQTVNWNVIFHASQDKISTVTVTFTGRAFAFSHMQYTYTNDYSASIHVTTKPIAILHVNSNPLTQSTLWVGENNNTGKLVIENIGKLVMENTTITAKGPVLVNNQNSFIIQNIDPGSKVSYPIEIDTSKTGTGTITVTYNGDFKQQSIIIIFIRPNPADSIELFFGRLFGYFAYILLFLSVVAGAGIYHLKKYISGRKIRIIHSDLANLSFTMVIIHAITLTIPNSPWSSSYLFFQLLPQQLPHDIGTLGLELGRNALVLMYIAVFSGFYLSKLIKRYGKRVGISIHMLSYVALIFGFVHTALIGGWANAYPIIIVIMFISLLSVGFLKWDAQRMLNAKKRAYEQRLVLKKIAENQTSGEKIESKIDI